MLKRFLFGMIAVLAYGLPASAQDARDVEAALEKVEEATETNTDHENMLFLDLIYGRVVIELYPDAAPQAVERIKTLSRQKFYDGLYFHRVIDGFMAQTGDPNGDGTGGSSLPDLPAEFSDTLHFEKGTLGMARSDSPDSANSQFFIVFNDEGAKHLDGKYTVFGKVTKGQRYVNRIMKGDGPNGSFNDPLDRDRVLRLRVAIDVINAEKEKAAAKEAEGGSAD